MEGRLQPPPIDEHEPQPQPPLPLPPGRSEHHTYIVQVPKDQVYRIPPPENALIVEQHRNPSRQGKSRTSSGRCCFLVCLALLVVIVATLTALYFVFKPKRPEISVGKLEVKKPPSSKKNAHGVPHYLISLKVKNPNEKSGLYYAKDGDVSMYYDSIAVAVGIFPSLDQGPGDSSPVKIDLAGSKDRPMPEEMQRSMNATKSKSKSNVAISLELEMKLEVKGKIGGMKIYGMNPIVNCKIKLSSLRDDARVLSQKCN